MDLNKFHKQGDKLFQKCKVSYEIEDNGSDVVNYQFKDDLCVSLKYDGTEKYFTYNAASNDPYDQHLKRLLDCKLKKDYNTEKFMKVLPKLVYGIHKYCTVCGTKLKYAINNISCCEDEDCMIKIETMRTDNYVTDIFEKDKSVFEFLIKTSLSVLRSKNRRIVFEPFPQRYRSKKVKRGTIDLDGGGADKNFTDIDKMVPTSWTTNNIRKLMMIMEKSVDDNSLIESLGQDLYELIRFILKTNKTNMYVNNITLNKIMSKTGSKNDMVEFAIKHKPEIEQRFKDADTTYLFHGSNSCNWYSILRNGLKNCSKSKMQLNGAAYGSGIYLAADANYSYRYSSVGEIIVLGVCQLINAPKYLRTTGIYVVPDEENVLLKYIYIIPRGQVSYLTYLNTYFRTTLKNESRMVLNKIGAIAKKRLTKEKKLTKSDDYDIDVSDDLSNWKATFKKLDSDTLKKEEVTIEMIFPKEYPAEPPFARVVKPRVKSISGNVLEGGAFSTKLLTSSGWKPTTRVKHLINLFKTMLEEDEFEITGKTEYDIGDAKKGFYKYVDLLNN